MGLTTASQRGGSMCIMRERMTGTRGGLTGALLLVFGLVASCGDDSETAAARVPDDRQDSGADVTDASEGNADSAEARPEGGDAAQEFVPDGESVDADAPPADTGTELDAGDGGGDTVDAGSEDGSRDAVSQLCGDSIRDPVTEECDDGPGGGDDSCTSICRVRSYPLVNVIGDGARDPTRSLGAGRHVAAAGSAGFGVVYAQADAVPTVRLQRFSERGQREGEPVDVAQGGQPTGAANPVVAALPGVDRYAVAWTDGTGGTPDVALRLVTAGSTPAGSPVIAHGSVAGPQQDPDLIWTGTELVVAWSDLFTVKYRRFSASLAATDIERTLSGATQFAGNVALAPFSGGWAAAWRSGDQGLETIAVRVGDSTWTTQAFLPAAEGDHPALVELDQTHLLVFYTVGGTVRAGVFDAASVDGRRLRAAVVDVMATATETLESTEILPAMEPYDRDFNLRQRRPTAARVGDRIFVAWETESPLADPLRAEFFVAELGWSPSEPRAIRKIGEWPAPADAIRMGDQKSPALAASPLLPGGALITLWEDHSRLLSGRPTADLMFEFRPVPFVRLLDDGG
jgi:hypothetical protein